MGIKQILEEVARMHPYRIPGRRETYDKYAEGWTDAIDEAESRLPEPLTEEEVMICKMYLEDLGKYKTCNEYKLLMGLLDGTATAPERGWIPVSERLPEERDSLFSKFHGTPRWRPSMWLRQSDRVLVTSELADGTRITETAITRDGEWEPDHAILKREIVAWMPMPKPYKEDRK